MNGEAERRSLPGRLLIVGLCAALLGCRTGRAEHQRDDYIHWLEMRSMLHQAGEQAARVSGHGQQWRHRYGEPQPLLAVKATSVWLLSYPGSVIPKPGQSVLASWADPQFWAPLRDIGIDLLHTNPVKRAGGITDRTYTPTIDGWFDPIALEIDPQLGTEAEYRQMVRVAGERGAVIAGDLVPLHTGLGPDFRLAERAYQQYPGIYTMVEIRRADWPLLPPVSAPAATALVPKPTAAQLKHKGYIPGEISSADAHPDARTWSGWSATGEVVGVDGQTRRWVFLHVFKPGQPALNWLDPSYGARRLLFGDAAQTIGDFGARIVRLDAVPFLGIEPRPGQAMAWGFMHPLSVLGSNDLAFMVRKLGGWSFQELNVPLEQLKQFMQQGPDLSYDFFTRAQVLHPLLTGDAGPLRLAHRQLLEHQVAAGALIHDLQNHDEITYQLVDLEARQAQTFAIDGEPISGRQLRQRILEQMRAQVGGPAAPYNKLYRPEKDGIATTFAGFAAAALGIRDPYHATPEQVDLIKRAHLLFAYANAMQPGVFALSSWDLVGALPLPEAAVAERTREGDYRWVNRGGVDLLGANPRADRSVFGLPRAQALYGPLPAQLKSPDSFASQLKRMLAARKRYRLAEAELLAAPSVSDRAVCVLVMKLPDADALAITAVNYRRAGASVEFDLAKLPGAPPASITGHVAHDIITEQAAGVVSPAGRLTLKLDPLSGRTVVLRRP